MSTFDHGTQCSENARSRRRLTSSRHCLASTARQSSLYVRSVARFPSYSADVVHVFPPTTRRGLAYTIRQHHPVSEATMSYAEIGKRAFSYVGPFAWNALLPSLHSIKDSKLLQNNLKRIILHVLSAIYCNACLDNYM